MHELIFFPSFSFSHATKFLGLLCFDLHVAQPPPPPPPPPRHTHTQQVQTTWHFSDYLMIVCFYCTLFILVVVILNSVQHQDHAILTRSHENQPACPATKKKRASKASAKLAFSVPNVTTTAAVTNKSHTRSARIFTSATHAHHFSAFLESSMPRMTIYKNAVPSLSEAGGRDLNHETDERESVFFLSFSHELLTKTFS